jgi:hypothetical protein
MAQEGVTTHNDGILEGLVEAPYGFRRAAARH